MVDWFWALSDKRSRGFGSPEPIPFREISAWSRVTGTLVTAEEVLMLAEMDSAFLAQHAENQKTAKELEES